MLPTGTKVTIKDSYQAYINIFIYPSASDFNKTEGKSFMTSITFHKWFVLLKKASCYKMITGHSIVVLLTWLVRILNLFIFCDTGLCGTYDGNQDNDLLGPDGVITKVPGANERPDEYSVKWRFSESNSIFNGYTSTVSMETPLYCSCYSDGTKSCDFFGDVSTCGVTNKGRETIILLLNQTHTDFYSKHDGEHMNIFELEIYTKENDYRQSLTFYTPA